MIVGNAAVTGGGVLVLVDMGVTVGTACEVGFAVGTCVGVGLERVIPLVAGGDGSVP